MGARVGANEVGLTEENNGPHTHTQSLRTNDNKLATRGDFYAIPTAIGTAVTGSSGQGTPHENRQPSLYLHYVIKI